MALIPRIAREDPLDGGGGPVPHRLASAAARQRLADASRADRSDGPDLRCAPPEATAAR